MVTHFFRLLFYAQFMAYGCGAMPIYFAQKQPFADHFLAIQSVQSYRLLFQSMA